ncbi:MAG TPA: hypothetical protein DCE48_01490 [Lachnospiraceae bacterium]|nr:hypothetical protein [Lachnospiraceae bacterium]
MSKLWKNMSFTVGTLGVIGSFILADTYGKTIGLSFGGERDITKTITIFLFSIVSTLLGALTCYSISEYFETQNKILDKLKIIADNTRQVESNIKETVNSPIKVVANNEGINTTKVSTQSINDTKTYNDKVVPTISEGKIVCPSCGEKQKLGRTVCWHCGTKFDK